MDVLPFLCILSVALTGLSEGVGVLPDGPLTAAVGDTVTFNTTVKPSGTPFVAIKWTAFNDITVVTATQSGITTGPLYEGRVTLFPNTGSLELRNVTLNDSGEYTLQLVDNNANFQDGMTSLVVLVPVSNVAIVANGTSLLEFNSSVTLSCSSSGTSISFAWLNGSSPVTDTESVQITDGGRTLTIDGVTRYDQGPFRCNASNAISHSISDPVEFSINFGPDDVNLTQSPPQQYVERGSNISLSCSVSSKPRATFNWYLNGELLQAGWNLSLTNVHQNLSGNYSCQAFNNKTLRYSTSRPAAVIVLERISDAYISSSSNLLFEGNRTNLTCGAAGSIFNRTWTKDGSAFIPSDNVTFHDDSRVLSFLSLEKSHSGEYVCKISNPINDAEARHSLVINFGPEDMMITGPSEITAKETLTLTCSVASTPAANYTWMHNGREIHFSPTFTKNSAEPSDSGNYTCRALNDITGRMLFANHHLSVKEQDSPFPPGAIAGIVIGICVLIGGIVAACCIYTKRRRSKSHFDTRSFTGKVDESKDNPAFTENKELHYEDLRIINRNDHGKSQCELEKSFSIYSEIKLNNVDPAPPSPPTYNDHMQRMEGHSVQSNITSV